MLVTALRCLQDNFTYVLSVPDQAGVWVVDPGDAAPVMQWLKRHERTLAGVYCTHHHRDHIAGVAALVSAWPGIPVVAHRRDQVRIPHVNQSVDDGQALHLCGLPGSVLHVPGHSQGACVLLWQGCLFSGDTLFGGGCGRLLEGTAAQLHASLQRLVRLPADTRVYFGHEYTEMNLTFAAWCEPANPAIAQRQHRLREQLAAGGDSTPSTLGEELQTNPFLRTASPELRATLGLPDASAETVFAALREARTHWQPGPSGAQR